MSWSWKESELSWSPTTYDIIDDETLGHQHESDPNHSEKNSNLSFHCRNTAPRKSRKTVRAKIWRPRFPGEKTANKIDVYQQESAGAKFENSTFHDKTTRNRFSQSNCINSETSSYSQENSVSLLNEASNTYHEAGGDFERDSSLHDYSLPPVSSLFEYPAVHDSTTNDDSYLHPENNYVPESSNFQDENDVFSMNPTSIDEFFWNTKKALSISLDFNNNMSLPVK